MIEQYIRDRITHWDEKLELLMSENYILAATKVRHELRLIQEQLNKEGK